MKNRVKTQKTSTEDIVDKGIGKEKIESMRGKKRNMSKELHVVGIGSSAGGLEALTALIRNLPSDTNMCYVVAQHLDPKRSSMLVPLLERHTEMPICEVKNEQQIKPNMLFVTPPNSEVSIRENRLYLSAPKAPVGPKPLVDLFFTSLAEEKADRCIGIILSGTGSDGAHGIRAIKAAGGITIVQNESTAKFDGMPHAAIITGSVDLVLAPEEIAHELSNLVHYPKVVEIAKEKQTQQNNFDNVINLLMKRTGCDFSEYKSNSISRRIEKRMALNKLTSFSEYVSFLQHSTREQDLLYRDILISVTSFFRDPEAWISLAKIIPDMVEYKKPGDPIRVWVPACATGEEAFTIAILLAETLGDRINKFKVQIYGTDLDEDAIAAARRGFYAPASVVNIGKPRLNRYFTKSENSFQVNSAIRERVIFARHNLVSDPAFLHLDLICCRNLLIYFKSKLQRKVVLTFHKALNPKGYLFLGKHEAISDFNDLFATEDRTNKIYLKRNTSHATYDHLLPSYHSRYKRSKVVSTSEKELTIAELTNQAITEQYDPLAVVIDENLNIQYIRGEANPFLTFKAGKTDLNLLNLVHQDLRVDVRVLAHKAIQTKELCLQKNIRFEPLEESKLLNVSVSPISKNHDNTDLYMVLFEEREQSGFAVQDGQANDSTDPRITNLEAELNAARERLQTTVEELETANEELQSLNEELQSSNEELQSSNEELETSNEELQATNEELITVNEEFQVKSAQLAELNSDLENILKSVDFPMLVVDKGLKITRFTSAAGQIFDLHPAESSQVITSIPCQISLPDLRQDLRTVLEEGQTIEKRVKGTDEDYWLSIYPYFSEHKQLAGAVLKFLDKSEVLRIEKELYLSEARFQEGPVAMAVVTLDGKIEQANKRFCGVVGYSEDELKNLTISSLMDLDDTSSDIQLIGQVLKGEIPYYQIDKKIPGKNKKPLQVHQTISIIRDEHDRPLNGLLMLEYVTEDNRSKRTSLPYTKKKKTTKRNSASQAKKTP